MLLQLDSRSLFNFCKSNRVRDSSSFGIEPSHSEEQREREREGQADALRRHNLTLGKWVHNSQCCHVGHERTCLPACCRCPSVRASIRQPAYCMHPCCSCSFSSNSVAAWAVRVHVHLSKYVCCMLLNVGLELSKMPQAAVAAATLLCFTRLSLTQMHCKRPCGTRDKRNVEQNNSEKHEQRRRRLR